LPSAIHPLRIFLYLFDIESLYLVTSVARSFTERQVIQMAKFLKALAYFGKELVEYNRDPKAWIESWEARHPAVEKCTHAWEACECPVPLPYDGKCTVVGMTCCDGIYVVNACGACEHCQVADSSNSGCFWDCTCISCEEKWYTNSDECLYYREPDVQCKCPRCYY
jgi:hypothetical protein